MRFLREQCREERRGVYPAMTCACHDMRTSGRTIGQCTSHTQRPPAPDIRLGGSVRRLMVVEKSET